MLMFDRGKAGEVCVCVCVPGGVYREQQKGREVECLCVGVGGRVE